MQDQHNYSNKTINVPQRGYGFRKNSKINRPLISKNYWSCIGVAGVHKSTEAAFLCHFDLPWTAWAIDDLVNDILSHSLDPKDFEIYLYGGFGWRIVLFLALLSGVIAACASWGFGIKIGILAGIITGAFFGGFYALTLAATRCKLCEHGFSKPKRIKFWSYSLRDGRHFQIRIGANENNEPEVKPQTPKGADRKYKAISNWYKKAHKSKDSD